MKKYLSYLTALAGGIKVFIPQSPENIFSLANPFQLWYSGTKLEKHPRRFSHESA